MKHIRLLLLALLAAVLPQTAVAEYYGLKVGGVSVTSDNCSNITGSNIKPLFNGYATTCSYDPGTKTLTLGNISIERSGSGNRAILNESCDGLTVHLTSYCQLKATNSSPLRFNANTTLTGSSALLRGNYEDVITVGNGATLTISDFNELEVDGGSYKDVGLIGDTGNEKLNIVNVSYLRIVNMKKGIVDFASLNVQNSNVYIVGERDYYKTTAISGIKSFTTGSNILAPTFSSEEQTFIGSDGSVMVGAAIQTFVPIDEEHFPDATFRAFIKTWDGGKDNLLTYSDVEYLKELDLSDKEDITSLKGIEYLHDLRKLLCSGTQLTEFAPGGPASLIELELVKNKLTSIDLSPFKNLRLLKCWSNQLTSLDVTPLTELETLDCGYNQLKALDVTKNTKLRDLRCERNQITRLDISKCENLETLFCNENRLTFLDFSHCSWLNKVSIGGNLIDAWMNETLESLPTVSEGIIWITTFDNYIGYTVPTENTCTQAQADIARQKGWKVVLDNTDDDGNTYYPIQIAGQYITSANRDDLTVLPYITKNHSSGYAYYDNTNNVLHLSGVDIVVPDSIHDVAISVSTGRDFSIQLGWKPVNIVTNYEVGEGIGFDQSGHTFNITSEDGETTSELNITTGGCPINTYSSLVIGGYAKVTLASERRNTLLCHNCDLTMKEHAELMLAPYSTNPLIMGWTGIMGDVNLEDGIGIVSPVGAYYDKSQGFIVDKDGKEVKGEVLFGQPRNYDLYIAGTRVNTSNLSDVLGDGGSVCFNGIDKLTLKNANIDGGTSQYGIDARFPINILLEGENNVKGSVGIFLTGESHIKGPGSLNASGRNGIYFNSPVIFIEDSAQVSAEGTERYAIAKRLSSSEEVVIRGSETFVRLKGVYGAVDIKRLTLEDGLQIALPKGAYFKDEWDGIVRANGSTIKKEWVTIANQDFVDANNKDADGNIIYNIAFAGDTITSAIAADLTVLPAISLNTEGGYARYDATDNSLHLSGVDIEVDADTKAHALDISTFRDASIVLGKDPVGIYSNYYDSSDLTIGIQGLHRSGNQQSLLTITTEEGAEQDGSLTISTQGNSFVAECGVTIAGKAKVSIESARKSAFSLQEAGGKNLTLKEDAGLTLTAKQEPMWMTYNCQLVMEDGIGILQPFGTTYSEDKRSLVDANGTRLSNTTVVIGKRTGYGIYLADTEVNNTNQADVLGDGTVSYDPDTQTLTLNNASIDGGADNYGIFAYVPFTIMLEGANTLMGVNGINTSEQTTITGTGSLYCLGETGILSAAPGITIEGGAHVKAEGTTGYGMGRKNASAGGITVRGEETVVEMKGMESPYNFNSLTLEDGLGFALPHGARFDVPKGCIVYWWGSAVTLDWVVIRKMEPYPIRIAGTQVTEGNLTDVLGDGTVSYDPEANTLTLADANIDVSDDWENYTCIDIGTPVEIKLVGGNILSGSEYGIYSEEALTISGSGSVQCSGMASGIRAADLVIKDGAHVKAEGTGYDVAVFATSLTVTDEETIVEMNGAEGALRANSLTLGDGMAILPTEARIDDCTFYNPSADETYEGRGLVGADGNPIKNQWVVIASQDYITGVGLTPTLSRGEGALFNLAGQRVGESYKGIVVTKDRKVLKK